MLLAGKGDEAPVANLAEMMTARDLGLQLAGVSRSLRTAVAATFARWDDSGARMGGALEERRRDYPTARAEAAAAFAEARAALAAEAEAEGGGGGGLSAAARSERVAALAESCLLYTSPSPRDKRQSRMPSSA